MAFQYLTNTPLERAREEFRAAMAARGFCGGAEVVPVPESCRRTTAEAVYAHICAPHYLAAAMDGIALRAAATFGATETAPITLQPADFVPIDTGAPLPDGCDAVVMIEEVVHQPEGGVKLHAAAVPWQNVRQIGEDVCAGEMLLTAHTVITPAAIGAMLAAGVMEVPVLTLPVVGIIPTGNEIVPPSANPAPGSILEFNSSIFSAMLREWGAIPKVYPIVRDDLAAITHGLNAALDECDVVLINAGSSAGRKDYTVQAVAAAGEVLFHGVAIKPGKPAILGCRGPKPILGVPGYPVSGILVLEELLRPLLDDRGHRAPAPANMQSAVLSRAVVSGLKYREFVRVRLGYVGDKLVASPLNRGSGVVTSFMKADGILEIPQSVEGYEAGARVEVRLLRPEHQLRSALVAIGSHDPLLDELANLLHLSDPSLSMSSSHVGSMGGLMAVRRGEAHLAGTHLLDEGDGSYNTAYIRRYFPEGGVRLVECVGRTQGLMLAPGNPLGITGVRDLARPGLRYVNRQKGSGTRILIDYLCRTEKIDTAVIEGYDREEFTHTAVAAQIAAGTADAGMGIFSAAKLYGLEFVPVCVEQYDLLIPDSAYDTPMVQRLLEILGSHEFRSRLTALGGYQIETPGRVREHFPPAL